MNFFHIIIRVVAVWTFVFTAPAFGLSQAYRNNIYDPGHLEPIENEPAVQVGDPAPEFTLPSLSGQKISLSDYRGSQNVVISFVPAAWTPVCSDQWPGYNIAESLFKEHNAILLGITVDNLPTLFAWTNQMGDLWFPILSDFWPHGETAKKFGILRSDGTAERSIFIVDKRGIIRFARVFDINKRPNLGVIIEALEMIDDGE